MDDKPKFDTTLLIPILFGLFSMFGICLVILLGYFVDSRRGAAHLETATPFEFVLLGTEPGFSTAIPNDEITLTPTKTPFTFATTEVPADTETAEPASTAPPLILSTRTATSVSTAPFNPGTYDETESRISYSGDWTVQSSVPDAFGNSLHVSSTLGNTASFRFIGQQVRLFYQSSPSLGTIRIVIDGLQFDLDQSASQASEAEWASSLLVNGTHTVVITHQSGGSINLDYIIVPDVLITPTVTSTPTITVTP